MPATIWGQKVSWIRCPDCSKEGTVEHHHNASAVVCSDCDSVIRLQPRKPALLQRRVKPAITPPASWGPLSWGPFQPPTDGEGAE